MYVHVYFTLLLLSPLRKKTNSVIWPNLNPLYARMFCARFDWNIDSGVEDFQKLSMYFTIWPLSPRSLKKCMALHLNKIVFHFPKNTLCQVKLKMAEWFRIGDFYKFVNIFLNSFLLYSLRKRARPFIWTKLKPLYPRMFCAKFSWNWLVGSKEVNIC